MYVTLSLTAPYILTMKDNLDGKSAAGRLFPFVPTVASSLFFDWTRTRSVTKPTKNPHQTDRSAKCQFRPEGGREMVRGGGERRQ